MNNDDRLQGLLGKVTALREVTVDIGRSAADHSTIDAGREAFTTLGTAITSSAGRLSRAATSAGCTTTMKLTVLILLCFLLIYMLARYLSHTA